MTSLVRQCDGHGGSQVHCKVGLVTKRTDEGLIPAPFKLFSGEPAIVSVRKVGKIIKCWKK